MNLEHITLSEWAQPNFRAVNKFYRSQKHKGSASGDERVFIASYDDQVIAAVRLVPQQGFYWLRSLYVKNELRGQHLGLALLTLVRQQLTPAIYCFPYTHLEDFYQGAGYSPLASAQLPEPLQQLFVKYRGKGQGIICMVSSATDI